MAQIPFPMFCIKIRTAPSWLEICSFMKGMPQKKVRLRASWPPTMVWVVIRMLVNLIYIWFFFFTLADLVFERWLGGTAVGVYISLLLTTKYAKRGLLTKLIILFSIRYLALKLKLLFRKIHFSEKYQGDYVGKLLEKYLWMNWMSSSYS